MFLKATLQKARVFSSGEPRGTTRNPTRLERVLSYVNQNPIMLDACLRKDDPGGEP